jgi:hypothetical protein
VGHAQLERIAHERERNTLEEERLATANDSFREVRPFLVDCSCCGTSSNSFGHPQTKSVLGVAGQLDVKPREAYEARTGFSRGARLALSLSIHPFLIDCAIDCANDCAIDCAIDSAHMCAQSHSTNAAHPPARKPQTPNQGWSGTFGVFGGAV